MSGEKTEKATSKKRNDAIKDGNLLSSKDVTTVISLFGVFVSLRFLFPGMIARITDYFYHIFALVASDYERNNVFFLATFRDMTYTGALVIGPIALAAMFFGILGSVVQNKPRFISKALKWDFKKLDPIKGMKKFFSVKSLFDVVKNLLKISVLLFIVWKYISSLLLDVKRLFYVDLIPAISFLLNEVMGLVIQVCMAFAVIAAMDYAFAKWKYEKDLKMSKQDIKDEHKQQEGDPKVKGKIKQKQMEMAMQRMMQEVPNADVVIRNPTHFAVALKYDQNRPGAPILVAKGQDHLALRIIAVAEEANVAVIENVPLARAIYATTELEREIPPEFYGTIAEILVYVYKLKNKQLT